MSVMPRHQMTQPEDHQVVEDPPNPDQLEVQQREEPALLVVPVRPVGPVTVQVLPARIGPAFTQGLNTSWQSVLGNDLKRRRATLLLVSSTAADTWLYSRTQGGSGVPWPANVPLVLEHADAVYAQIGPGNPAATLSVITEVWAD